MPQLLTTSPGDTLSSVSDRILNDPLRFPEILDLNPSLDVFSELPQELPIQIPDLAQQLNFAQPALSSISQSVGGVGRWLSEAERQLNSLVGNLPSELQGYAQDAINAVGDINGITGDIQQTVGEGLSAAEQSLRSYQGELVQLVPWLLGRR